MTMTTMTWKPSPTLSITCESTRPIQTIWQPRDSTNARIASA